MPKLIVRHPDHDEDRSLGWLAIDWIEFMLEYGTGQVTGDPVVVGDDTASLLVDAYAYDARGRRLYDSAFFSAPKGTDKSGLAARVALFEGLGPCRIAHDSDGAPMFARGGEVYRDPWGLGFEYEYQAGEPIGAHIIDPRIALASVGSDQINENVYGSVLYNLREGKLAAALDNQDDAGMTRILLPRNGPSRGGFIKPVTSGSKTKDGGLQTWNAFDETHLFVEPEVKAMYQTYRRNLQKRRREGTWYLETTTMYGSGENSVAEETYKAAELVRQAKAPSSRMLVHHRYGEITAEQLGDFEIRDVALREAFGETLSANGGWRDLEELHEFCLDPQNPVSDLLRYQFNVQAETSNQWILAREWRACSRTLPDGKPNPLKDDVPDPDNGDTITLGFDGSRGRKVGVADVTGLVATRLSDGLQWVVDYWKQPDGARDWSVPMDEVNAVIAQTFEDFNVVGFYADPAFWGNEVATWEALYGTDLRVKASDAHPIELWMTGGSNQRTARFLEAYRMAVVQGDMTHVDNPILTEHILNARAVLRGSTIQIAKPEEARKIDLAVAAMLSWSARKAAIAAGVTDEPDKPKRRGRLGRLR